MDQKYRPKPLKSSPGVGLSTGGICFCCEQIFSSRTFLEEHICPSANHICSCGTEFSKYADMLIHNSTHEPGQQVLDHETIRKRRFQKHIEEEEKLKRFKSGQVVWNSQKADGGPTTSLGQRSLQAPGASASLLPNPKRPAQISQVPALNPSSSLFSKPRQKGIDMKNMFSGVGSPTVDLWTLYQPVVLVQTVRKFNKWKPYTCAKCGEGFITKRTLISHASIHVTDKVSGCIGCGMLLCSRKLVPRFHDCNSPITQTKLKLVTARPLNYKSPIPSIDLTQESPRHHLTSAVNRNKSSQVLQVTSALQLKNLNVRTYSRSAQGPHASMSQQMKKQNSLVNAPHNTYASIKSNWKHSSTSAAMSFLSQPMQTPSDGNEFKCRVCYIPFESTMQLQRHKCAKAKEFMAKHGRLGKLIKPRRVNVMPVPNPDVTQVNGERNCTFPVGGTKEQVSADKGEGAADADAGGDLEDDCYIVESQPEKPAEVIYQVTSSVPIKT
ncbi:uncharacterized protein [Nerophis lumbriciformis]|uniref:uncharacterized protein n=1 Tax=Nerophis lumbriciformis TaxID=546530 RepID=UPI002ADFD510|nr:uncharacterized protein LOC133599394 [Nerophis lumbriciformis]